MNTTFKTKFVEKLRSYKRKRQIDNFDTHRFAREMAAIAWWKRLAISLGILRLRSIFRTNAILKHSEDLEWTYKHLSDDESRQTLVSVMAFRALGRKRVKLDTNNPERLQSIERIEQTLVKAKSSQTLSSGQSLDDFDLHPLGIPIVLRGRMGNVLYPFMLNQYRLERNRRIFEATLGDIIIDAGGCYGDTALYFANAVGPSGMVYCYEFDPENLDVYRRNMLANPELGARVQLVEYALWSAPGQEMHFVVDGAGTRVVPYASQAQTSNVVVTDTIDAMAERLGVSRVDLIKMDIEGAELAALQGAQKTILRDRPKLAICLYHQLDHFWKIPQFIDSLRCGYEFRIGHFTIHAEETVLFAEAAHR